MKDQGELAVCIEMSAEGVPRITGYAEPKKGQKFQTMTEVRDAYLGAAFHSNVDYKVKSNRQQPSIPTL